jgi:N-hydroxyarylamine O-acetyltransferase
MDADRYLDRIGVEPASVGSLDHETLTRLQRAHVLSVPFETLSITGDPHGDRWGGGVSLDRADLYRKVVDERRGGFCYELNGLFGSLLGELGFDRDRLAGLVLDDDGAARPPANHLTTLVSLDRSYVVDVGMGGPRPRAPVPLDGTAVAGDDGVAWRVEPSDRPDADYLLRYRPPGDDWQDRFVFDTAPRELSYVRATCDYLQTAPESPFTGDPVVIRSTPTGYRKLTPDELVVVSDGEEVERREVDPEAWYDRLESEFGVPLADRTG